MSHYETLGVPTTVSNSELKAAYRQLVKQYHPDLNPGVDTSKIAAINEAYEILSDNYARSIYDMTLQGYFQASPREETHAEKYRREYLHKKAQRDREHLEYMIKLKTLFYRVQRVASVFFFAVGLFFSIDYYVSWRKTMEPFNTMTGSDHKTSVIFARGTLFVEPGLYDEFAKNKEQNHVQVSYSSVFQIPTKVGLPDGKYQYKVYGTVHAYRNVFPVIILFMSIIVLRNKEYTDFRLTCGLVPIFLVAFLLIFVGFIDPYY
jgi:curved DNA-binding protein CbpA